MLFPLVMTDFPVFSHAVNPRVTMCRGVIHNQVPKVRIMTAARQLHSVQMDEDEARALTDQIIEATTTLWGLISIAYAERAWAALGYETWDDYVAVEFGSERLTVARGDRPAVVGILREAGMSVRAISAVTGDSLGTVHATVVELDTAPATTAGLDGKNHPAKRKPRPAADKKPKPPPVSSEIDMMAVARPEMAPDGTFGPSAGVGYGDPEFGACVVDGEVRWFSEGSYDEISPDAARFLAACLLAAADAI